MGLLVEQPVHSVKNYKSMIEPPYIQQTETETVPIYGLEHFESRNLSTAILDWSGVVPHRRKRTERASIQVTQLSSRL